MESAHRGQQLAGIATIVATVCGMALADAFVKLASSDMTLWQIYVLRSLLVAPALVYVARRSILVSGMGWVILRSLALAFMYVGIYAAIPLLDLSVIAAALYTGPLFIVVFSRLFLSEPISAKHWAAIFIGFAGVLCIVRPAAADFTPYALIPISAGLLYAIAAVLTKAKCSSVPPATMALWLNATLFVVGSAVSVLILVGRPDQHVDYPFLFSPWTVADWPTLCVLAALMIGISIGLAKAYQAPRPQVIATFDYAYLLFAGLWGFLFFGEIPDLQTVGGMALIILAGMVVLAADLIRRAPAGSAVSG